MVFIEPHRFLLCIFAVARLTSSFTPQTPSQIAGASVPLVSGSTYFRVQPVQPAVVSDPASDRSRNLSAAASAAVCDGNKYGFEVRSSSCIDALEIIPDIEKTVSVGPRQQGHFTLGACNPIGINHDQD